MRKISRLVGVGSISLFAMTLMMPKLAFTNVPTQQEQKYRDVSFYIVNNSSNTFCMQGKAESTPICVPPSQQASQKVAEPIVVKTAYFYTKSGLIKHWQNTDEDNAKLALVADGASEVHLSITDQGIYYKGLNTNSGTDLAEYVKWNGLKNLLI